MRISLAPPVQAPPVQIDRSPGDGMADRAAV
jgi:hypothetical protein